VDAETAAALLAPAHEDLFEAYEISPAVNRVTNDYPGLLEPAPVRTTASAASEETAASEAGVAPKRARKQKKDDRQSSLFE